MTMKQRKCVICGKLYTPTSPSQILCGSVECKKARHKQYIKEHEEMYKELNKEYRQREENKIEQIDLISGNDNSRAITTRVKPKLFKNSAPSLLCTAICVLACISSSG